MAFHPFPNGSIPSREAVLAQIPTAIQAYSRADLTQEQIENQAYPIIMALAQSIDQNVYRQRALYNFSDSPRQDVIPLGVVMYVARFFEERGYSVEVMDAGIVLEWSSPRPSEHDDSSAFQAVPTTEELRLQVTPDGSLQYTGVRGHAASNQGELMPRYTIGMGDRSVTRKP